MILGIDTSLGTAVAVVEADGVVRATRQSDNPLGHAEVIGDLLVAVLADAGESGSSPALTHVAAGMGPGPFTGLRIGIAAARAFALGRSIPVVPVVSHDAIALEVLIADAMAGDETERFAVVTDARRREVAYSVYDGIDGDGLPVRLTGPALVPRDGLDAVLGQADARRHDATVVSGAMIGLIAGRAILAGRDAGPGQPLYLRSPDVTLPAGRKRVTT